MTAEDLHALTGAFALDALSEREAGEFDRHLSRCPMCAQEVSELRETAARLALAVAEVPPADLRARVMDALPEVRQLPPGDGRSPVVRVSARRRRRYLPHLAVAACLTVAVVAGGIAVDEQHDLDRQRDRTAVAERQADAVSALLSAPDAAFRTQALAGGGTATLVSSRRAGQAAVLFHDLPELPGSRVYQLWYSRGGVMVPAGLVGQGRSTGSTLLAGSPHGAEGVGLTAEPHGGSPRPTTAPLVLLRL